MAHFAKLDENNIVIDVIVVSNDDINNLPFPESEPIGIAFCQSLFGGNWKQTSYNANFRKYYAMIGGKYDEDRDIFIPLKSFDSWIWDDLNSIWVAPVEYPNDGKVYYWDETTQSWIEQVS